MAVPVLVVVEDGNVHELAQPRLDLEAARSSDVLEVDAAETGSDRNDSADDLVGVGGREADRPGVDAGELLEEDRLAFHHRQGGFRADVAEAEHSGSVRDDRDRIALAREVPDFVRVVGDRSARTGDARRVGHREVVRRLERDFRSDLELAAAVEQQRAVGNPLDLDAVLCAHHRRDARDMWLVDGENRHVSNLLAVLEPDEVDRVEEAAGVADRSGHARERARAIVEVHAKRGAERGGGVRRDHPPSLCASGIDRIRGATGRVYGKAAVEIGVCREGIGTAVLYLQGSEPRRRAQ